jgi:CRP-like cAMP-binding protein
MTLEGPMSRIDFRSLPLFACVTDDELRRLNCEGREIEVGAGVSLYQEGEAVDSLYTLLEGRVAMTRQRGKAECILLMPCAGSSFPVTSLAGGGRSILSATTVSSCRLVVVPVHTVHDLITGNNDFAQAVIAAMLSMSKNLVEVSHSRGLLSPTERLANWLVDNLAPRPEVEVYPLPFKQRVIAAALGMSIATLAREFARLEEHGVELARSTVRIRDAEELRRLASG